MSIRAISEVYDSRGYKLENRNEFEPCFLTWFELEVCLLLEESCKSVYTTRDR